MYTIKVQCMMCTTCLYLVVLISMLIRVLSHTQVDWNEVFGCPGSVKFHISWLYPTPVRFPTAVKDLILGYTVRDPSAYDHHSRHSSRTGSGSSGGSGGSPRLLDSGGKDGEGDEEGADERAPLRGASYHSKTGGGSGGGGGMIGMYIHHVVYTVCIVRAYTQNMSVYLVYTCKPHIQV